VSQYCTPTDVITYAIPATALPKGITVAEQVAACVAASGEADSYMRARYPLPITGSTTGGAGVFDPALVRHTAYIAGFTLMSQRGFAPGAGTDQNIRENYYKAVGWPDRPGSGFFPGVERQHIHLDVLVSQATPPAYNLPTVYSHRPRGI
jgi:phage gp36-like protein